MEKIVGGKVLYFFKRTCKKYNFFLKQKMLSLTKEELKSHQDAKVRHICRKRFLKKFANNKNYWKVRDQCHCTGKYKGAAHTICNLKLNVPN